MSDNTITLDVARQKDRLRIALSRANAPLAQYERFTASMAKIDNLCRNLAEAMNAASRKGSRGDFERLQRKGRALCDNLLSSGIKEKLFTTEAANLILTIDDSLVHIPYELLCIDQEFLCARFNMGRKVRTWQDAPERPVRELKKPLALGIVADPEGSLPFAREEGEKIFRLSLRANREEDLIRPNLNFSLNPTADDVKERIRDFDIFHFTGHADYHPRDADKNGWRLNKGVFSINRIDEIAGGNPMPSLIFSNACQSARTEGWPRNDKQGSPDLANSFLRAGVQHYIGTLWEIADEKSGLFAVEFYKHLCSGKSVGEAVRLARTNLTAESGPDICWASYQLYGDPTFSYFSHTPPDARIVRAESSHGVASNAAVRSRIKGSGETRTSPPESGPEHGFRKKIKTPALVFFLLLISLSAIYAVPKYFHAKSEIDKVALEGKQAELIKRLEDLSNSERKKIRQRFDDLLKLAPPSETRRFNSCTIAVVFDTRTEYLLKNKEKFRIAIENQIQAELGKFYVVDRGSFLQTLDLLILKYKRTAVGQREPLEIMLPGYLLIVGVVDNAMGEPREIAIRCDNVEKGMLIDSQFGKYEKGKALLGNALLERLKAVESKCD